MEKLYHLLLLLGSVFRFQTANCISSPINRIDHLPTNIKPESYDLSISFDFDNNDVPFSGIVGITIKCEDNTDTIILNVKELKIVENDVTVTSLLIEGKTPIEVIAHTYNELRDQYIITLAEKLEARQKYEVYVPFKKESLLDFSDLGLVRYSYKTKNDKVERLENQTVYEFEDSIPISPCSLGLAVAEIDKENKVTSASGLSMFVWSSADIFKGLSDRKLFFNEMSGKVIDFYFSYFNSLPPIKDYLELLISPKVPQIYLQKSRLMMLDESTFFSSVPFEKIDEDTKADIVLHLCSVINRQWLDAAINMSNWNEYWVQIALATFVRAPCLEKLLEEKKFNPLNMQLIETFTNVLRNDGESVSRPIHVNEENFDLTTAFADPILFEKAHLLIKMMHFFVGEKLFQDSMRKYYKDTEKDGTSTLDQLWLVFDTKAHTKENLLPKDTTIKMIMESWVLKKGHPVINMDIDYKNGTAMLKQERFVQLEDKANENETIRENDYWIIPVNYATKAEFKEEEKPKSHIDLWLLDGTAVTIPSIPKDWALLNLQLSVPCRVNYDKNTRKLLYETLMNTDEYKIIDEKSRIQLVFDMFALAEVGRMPYRTLLVTMKYLKHEDSDLVLMVALYELNKIHSALFNTNMTEFYENYMKEILEKIFERPRFAQIDDLSERTKQEKQVKKLVFELSCKFGVEKCVEQVDHLFKKFKDMDNPDDSNIIPEDIREILYCQAIKHGSLVEWNFLHELYEKSEPVRQKAILTALGYSEDNDTLEEYLSEFHDHKFPPAYHQSIINGLAANDDGHHAMKVTFLFKSDEIIQNFKGYNDTIGFYLVKLLEFINVKDDFNNLKGIIDLVKDQLSGVEDILKDSVRMAKKKVIWLEKYMMEITNVVQYYPHLLDSLDDSHALV